MDVVERLKRDFRDSEYRTVYDEGFLNSSLATQIKVLREEREWTQTELAEKAGMNQSRVSELEDINFSSWTIRTLRKLAKAFDLRLKISFEEFGTLLGDFRTLNRNGLSRRSFAADAVFQPAANQQRPRLAQMPSVYFATTNGNENVGGTAWEMGSSAGNNSTPRMPPGSACSQANIGYGGAA
jgi:transcriptional regulator with XRE-family HTH domain